jgi:glycosyltransferase involved in cell wall biosynthesis
MQKVSVIIPCFNQASFLSEAIQSIIAQTHENWECIIVNDGSPDDTESVAQTWCSKDSRIRYIYQQNQGLSSARNFGIQNAAFDFILTLDADDKYDATFIEKGLKILNENPKVGVVSSWISRFKGGNEICVIKPNGKTIEDFMFQNASNGTSLFRKKCWVDVGGYDEKMKKGYEDWDFYIRVCANGWNVHIIPEVLFFYRQHDFSMRLDAYANHDKNIKMYMYSKHKELYLNHYEDMVAYFLNTIDLEKRNIIKTRSKIDYKIGFFILKPFRKLKSLFR